MADGPVLHDAKAAALARGLPVERAEALARALEDTQTAWGSSRWAAYRKCPRLHYLTYDVGVARLYAGDQGAPIMASGRPAYFAVGSLCHGILRYMQEGAMLGQEWPWLDVLTAADAAGANPEALDEAHRLMSFYWMHWGTENGGWPLEAKIAGVEEPLQTPDDAAVLPHTGRADTILEMFGDIVIVDTKTRGRALPKDLDEYAASLATRPQFLSLSAMLQRSRGLEKPPAVMVNAIVKTKLPACGRVMVPITQAQVDAWWLDHAEWSARCGRDATERALDAEAGIAAPLHAPRNLDNCAPEIGERCSLFGYCHGSDETRKLHYTIRPRVT